MKNRTTAKQWMIPLCLLLVIVILSAVFWDTLAIYLAPKTVLTSALTHTTSLLQNRFSNSPVWMLAKVLDIPNGNTVSLELDTENKFAGNIKYDMDLQIRHHPRQIFAEGNLITSNSSLDLSLYLDQDFAAISSQNLLQGNYYGITYDTFPLDIRSNPLLTFMIGSETISQWEQEVDNLQTQMSKEVNLPEISEEDLKTLSMGILALKADVQKDSLTLLRGEQACHVIRFQASGEQILDGLRYAQAELPFSVNKETSFVSHFYLVDKTVVRCTLELTSPGEEFALMITPDLKPDADSINVLFLHNKEGSVTQFGATISTDSRNDVYSDEISIGYTQNNIQNNYIVRYSWNRETGALSLNAESNGITNALVCKLTETESGCRLYTDDVGGLISLFTKKESNAAGPCTMDISKGASIVAPPYKNFDQWSTEDLLVLLVSIGSLFGLGVQ